MTEEQLADQAKRLFPHLKKLSHSDDELVVTAKKLYPHIQDEFHKDVGKSVVRETAGMLRKALWAAGAFVLALLGIKWAGK